MSTTNHYTNNPEFYNELFQGTDYWNTYQGILKQYSNTPQDTFWGSITGGNSQRLFEHYQNRDAALNALVEQMRTDQYNSPESAMMRDRAAGLNPDLLGVNGGEPSQSIGPTDQPSMMDSIHGDVNAVSSTTAMFVNILTGATNMLHQFKNLDVMDSQIELNDMAVMDAIELRAHKALANYWASVEDFNPDDPNSGVGDLADTRELFIKSYKNPKTQRKAAEVFNRLSMQHYDMRTEGYKTLDANRKAKKHFLEKMVEYEVKAQKYGYKSSIAQDAYTEEYYNSLDASEMADYETKTKRQEGWLAKWREDYYKTMYNDFLAGSNLAGLILVSSGQYGLYPAVGTAITGLAKGLANL